MTVVKIEDVKLNDEERQPCEVWTRVMGYLRPVSEFNKGKKSEFYTRKYFAEGKARAALGCGCEHIDIAAE
ncbi:MAG: anaerobic ribonucleoside-triphosphate reductase [Rhodospirillales bacterium]|nr:anaerobic ribonucleoside-triphosphate reductase [Rhodospirillales bacterium]